ncbi:unnamed protein product [Didymodactylos carnosus]|uniref:Uncharacterized protein n=1 Tax=Didymodactylos carnosus TaxID=1234261 RepID=A0A814NKB6_9BILA|nr:unnamed protein product [Didymodactylos carnosus]CAF3858095.1 unnamed protein product [Didymodactylos carnosus]
MIVNCSLLGTCGAGSRSEVLETTMATYTTTSPTQTATISQEKSTSITLHQLYDIFYTCEKDVRLAVIRICEVLDVEERNENKETISKLIHSNFVRKKSQFENSRRRSNQQRQNEYAQIILYKSELKQHPKPPKSTSRDFSEVGNKQKKRRLTDLNEELDEFAANNLTVNQVLGYLIHQRNHQTNKKLIQFGKEFYETDDLSQPNIQVKTTPPQTKLKDIVHKYKERAENRRLEETTGIKQRKVTEILVKKRNGNYKCPRCSRQFKPQGITGHVKSCAKKWCVQNKVKMK